MLMGNVQMLDFGDALRQGDWLGWCSWEGSRRRKGFAISLKALCLGLQVTYVFGYQGCVVLEVWRLCVVCRFSVLVVWVC